MLEAYNIDHFPLYTHVNYLEWDGRWELIDGIAYAMSPAPYPKHQRIVVQAWRELSKNLDCQNCMVYVSPIDWKVDESTVVQPDVAIFCEETLRQYFSKKPPLIIEVLSKSTALKDVTTKFSLYEKEGVKYYIIIEPESEISDVFELIDGKYQLMKKITKEDSFNFEFDQCKTFIDFGTLF